MTTTLKSSTKTVDLANYGSGNPFDIDYGIKIVTSSGDAIYGNSSQPWTVTNAGEIEGAADGIDLRKGGIVTNKSSGRIVGSESGVYLRGGDEAVTNAGEIDGGINISSGFVNNEGKTANIRGSDGIYIAHTGTVINGGTINGAFDGIFLLGSGTVTNLAGALITGSSNGIYFHGEIAALSNFGTITATGTHSIGVDASVVVNRTGGLISGVIEGVKGYVNNAGTIEATGSAGIAVYGDVKNNAGTIEAKGRSGTGVVAYNIDNNAGGVIEGTSYGIKSPDRGSYEGRVNASGLTILNAGVIEGAGTAGIGISMHEVASYEQAGYSGNTLTNSGTISGVAHGVYIGGNSSGSGSTPSIFTNSGTVMGTGSAGIGVEIPGSELVNLATGVIRGTQFAVDGGDGGTVQNAGKIDGTGSSGIGIYSTGLAVTNFSGGLIEGTRDGVEVVSPYPGSLSTVTNAGVIEATGSAGIGIDFTGIGTGAGIGTVTNSGTIIGGAGGDSIKFGAGNDRLIVDPGAVFIGKVDGGAGTNTLELAGTGAGATLSGTFVNFGSVTVDSDASWILGGAEDSLLGKTHLNDCGTLTLNGTAILTEVVSGTGTVALGTGSVALNHGAEIDVADWALVGTGIDLNESLTFAGSLTSTAGSALTIGSGDALRIDGEAMLSGKIGGAGLLNFAGGGETIESGAAITAASWSLTGGATVAVDEILAFAGTFSLGAAPTLTIAKGDALDLSGHATFTGDVGGLGTLAFTGGTEAIETTATFAMADWTLAGGAVAAVDKSLTYDGAFTDAAGTSLNIRTTETLTLGGAVTGAGMIGIGANATLVAGGLVGSGQDLAFDGAGALLQIDDPTGFAGQLTGFKQGDYIDIDSNAFAYSDSETIGFTENSGKTGGTLTLTSGANTFKIALFGQYTAAGFSLAAGNGGGVLISYATPGATQPPLVAGHG